MNPGNLRQNLCRSIWGYARVSAEDKDLLRVFRTIVTKIRTLEDTHECLECEPYGRQYSKRVNAVALSVIAGKLGEQHGILLGFVQDNREDIERVLPDSKDALKEYLKENPYEDEDEFNAKQIEFDKAQKEEFVEEIGIQLGVF